MNTTRRYRREQVPTGTDDRRGRAKTPTADRPGGLRVGRSAAAGQAQWKESPQAQDPVALGLSMVKPCFSMVSTKSIRAPLR